MLSYFGLIIELLIFFTNFVMLTEQKHNIENMELETRKLSILQVIAQLQNTDVLVQIEKILQEQAKELFYFIQAKQTEHLLGISQTPRKITTNLKELAKEQNYKPRKQYLIGALPKDEISFVELSKMIEK